MTLLTAGLLALIFVLTVVWAMLRIAAWSADYTYQRLFFKHKATRVGMWAVLLSLFLIALHVINGVLT